MKTTLSPLRFTAIPAFALAGILLAAATTSAQEQTDSATGLTYTIANGKATVTGGTVPNDGHLVIPGTLGGAPVRHIKQESFREIFYDRAKGEWVERPHVLKKLSAPSVQRVGKSAFSYCENLTEIHLPEVDYIERDCFRSCNIKSVSLPKVRKLEINTFINNVSLESAFLPEATELSGGCFSSTKLSRVYLGRAAITYPGTPGDPFWGINDITIYHHPEDAEHYSQGDFARQTKQQVSRPFAEPVGIASGTGTATLRIRHAAKTSGDDWTYTVEQSTDLAAWAEATPSASDSNTADSVVTKSRTVPAGASAAFYRVQASPNFMN